MATKSVLGRYEAAIQNQTGYQSILSQITKQEVPWVITPTGTHPLSFHFIQNHSLKNYRLQIKIRIIQEPSKVLTENLNAILSFRGQGLRGYLHLA